LRPKCILTGEEAPELGGVFIALPRLTVAGSYASAGIFDARKWRTLAVSLSVSFDYDDGSGHARLGFWGQHTAMMRRRVHDIAKMLHFDVVEVGRYERLDLHIWC